MAHGQSVVSDIQEKYVCVTTRGFNTATINAVRRAMILHIPCYGFDEMIDPEDYELITGTKPEQRNVVLVNTTQTQSIPILAQRCSRIPLQTTAITRPLLESHDKRKVFFAVCKKPENEETWFNCLIKPYTLEGEIIKRIYSKDLEPVVLTRSSIDEEFQYDENASDEVREAYDDIFPYNILIVQMSEGEKVNIVLRPVMGTGIENSRWTPCTYSYRMNMDPKWLAKGEHLISQNGTVRRKVHGKLGLRDLITMDPETEVQYNRFGKPYGHMLMIQYNGKMPPIDAFTASIRIIKEAVNIFLKYYLEGNELIHKTVTHIRTDDERSSVMEVLSIPKNTEDELPVSEWIHCDHTIGNLLTTKMLEIISERDTMTDALWSQVHIAYKIPHPNIRQCIMMIKLPSELDMTHEELMKETVRDIVDDLNKLSDKVV